MKKFHIIIEEICKQNNINYKLLSNDWIYFLEKNNKVGYITGYKFDLNGHGIGNVLDDKYAFYSILSTKGFPAIMHHIIFKNYKKEELENLFNKYDKNIVVKSNTGTCGNEVFYVRDLNALFDIVEKLFSKHISISICPFYHIKNEYRLIMLDNVVKVLYGKKRPIVVGDGKSTIRELLLKFNSRYFNSIYLDDSFDKVLIKNEIFEYGWKFNLSQGASIFQVDDLLLKNKLINMSMLVSKKLGLSFCSIDIIETIDNQLLIMEANSGVMMDSFIDLYPNGYNIAKDIYEEAIMKMLN